MDKGLRLRCRVVQDSPLWLQEGEVAHSEFPGESAVLETREEAVGMLLRLPLNPSQGFHDACPLHELSLNIDWRDEQSDTNHSRQPKVTIGNAVCQHLRLVIAVG